VQETTPAGPMSASVCFEFSPNVVVVLNTRSQTTPNYVACRTRSWWVAAAPGISVTGDDGDVGMDSYIDVVSVDDALIMPAGTRYSLVSLSLSLLSSLSLSLSLSFSLSLSVLRPPVPESRSLLTLWQPPPRGRYPDMIDGHASQEGTLHIQHYFHTLFSYVPFVLRS